MFSNSLYSPEEAPDRRERGRKIKYTCESEVFFFVNDVLPKKFNLFNNNRSTKLRN